MPEAAAARGTILDAAGLAAQLVPHNGGGWCQEEKDHCSSRRGAGDHPQQRALDLALAVTTRRSFNATAAAAERKDKKKQRQRGSRSGTEYFGSDHVDQGIGVRSFKYFVPKAFQNWHAAPRMRSINTVRLDRPVSTSVDRQIICVHVYINGSDVWMST
jgi:hypothetical protein